VFVIFSTLWYTVSFVYKPTVRNYKHTQQMYHGFLYIKVTPLRAPTPLRVPCVTVDETRNKTQKRGFRCIWLVFQLLLIAMNQFIGWWTSVHGAVEITPSNYRHFFKHFSPLPSSSFFTISERTCAALLPLVLNSPFKSFSPRNKPDTRILERKFQKTVGYSSLNRGLNIYTNTN